MNYKLAVASNCVVILVVLKIALKKAVFALGFKKPSVITLRVALRKAVCLSDSFE